MFKVCRGALLFLISFFTVFITSVLCDSSDGGKAPRVTLNDGNTMPVFGLGTFLGFNENGQKLPKDGEVEIPMTWALDAGYRMFDTAQKYFNEDQVGSAVRKSAVPRENIFIVTKLASNRQREPVEALRDSLRLMNLSYVDLYLIHNTVAFKPNDIDYDVVDYLDTWKGMEETKKLGLAKTIGVSNFNDSQIERIVANCDIKPAVLQVEANLNLAQNKLLETCKKHNIVMMAYSPFGSLFSTQKTGDVPPPPRANDPEIVAMAKKYGKTVPQIVLKYLVQRGLVPIPKSVRKEKIEENINIFDFELTPEDMETLSKYNKDYRTVDTSFWQDHPYYPYEKKNIPAADPFKKEKE